MKIREAARADLPFIVAANAALASETEGQTLNGAMFGHIEALARQDPRICGIRLYVDRGNERAQGIYARLGMHRTNYGIMEAVYRGPESHEEAPPC